MRKNELNNNIYISTGNRKLMENETSYFLIFNLPAVTTCPNRTPMCEKSCYARKAERLYSQVLPSRESNYRETLKDTFVRDMVNHIQYHLDKPKNKGRKCYFRIHESGDFYDESYMMDFIEIAWLFPQIQFLAYTKSVGFLYNIVMKGNLIPKNLIFRFSKWDDTPIEDYGLALKLDLPIYTAFDKKVLEDKVTNLNYLKCDCDCQKCKACYTPCKKIATAIH